MGRTKTIDGCGCCETEVCCPPPTISENHAIGWVFFNYGAIADGFLWIKTDAGPTYQGEMLFRPPTPATEIYFNNNLDMSEEKATGVGVFWKHPDQGDITDSNFDKTHPANRVLYSGNYYGNSIYDISWVSGHPLNRTDFESVFMKGNFSNSGQPDGQGSGRLNSIFSQILTGPIDFGVLYALCLKKASENLIKASDVNSFFLDSCVNIDQHPNGDVKPPWSVKKDSWYIINILDTSVNTTAFNDSDAQVKFRWSVDDFITGYSRDSKCICRSL